MPEPRPEPRPEDDQAVTETFAFTCGDCGETWERTFDITFLPDPAGLNPLEYVDEDGRAMRSPLADAVCGRCGGRKVHVLSPELADRARAAEHTRHSPHHSRHLPHVPHRSRPAARTEDEAP